MTEAEEIRLYLDPLRPLIASLQLEFNDPWVLREALTDCSFFEEYRGERLMRDYERLELLGDAVVGLLVKEILLFEFREAGVGEITEKCASLTSNDYLAQMSTKHELHTYVLMNSRSHGVKWSVRACLLEALIGAIYVDQGQDAARSYVEKLIMGDLQAHFRFGYRNPIAILHEVIQGLSGSPAHYEDRLEWRVNRRVYVSVVMAGQRELAWGEAPSKKEARRTAAEHALRLHFPNQKA